jgi:TolA-binding protein
MAPPSRRGGRSQWAHGKATLEDAAKFVGAIQTWCQAYPHCDYAAELLLKAAQTRRSSYRTDRACAGLRRVATVMPWGTLGSSGALGS